MIDSDASDGLYDVGKQLDRLYLAMREIDNDIPQYLFHYTNPQGLVGIVTSKKLWASSADFLNDSSEPSYAFGVLKTCFDEIVSSLRPGSIAAEALDGYWEQIMHAYETEGPHVYVFCLSDDDDLLSQWRAYGGQCGGYAVGFSGIRLREYFTQSRYQGQYLMKIVYDEEKQMAKAKHVFRNIISIIEEVEEKRAAINDKTVTLNATQIGKRLQTAVFSEVVRLRTTFKARAFQEEREWRIVQFLHPAMEKPEVQFRPDSKALTPYVELDLGMLPIERVTIGPILDPSLSRQSLDRLFAKQKYSSVCIKNSDVPYRQ